MERTEGEVAVTTAAVTNQRLVNIQANNRVLMAVTEQDARDLGLLLETLADSWAERLEQAMGKLPVALDVVQRLDDTLLLIIQRPAINE